MQLSHLHPGENVALNFCIYLGTCESAVCVRIEYESNRALRFEFESNLEASQGPIFTGTEMSVN